MSKPDKHGIILANGLDKKAAIAMIHELGGPTAATFVAEEVIVESAPAKQCILATNYTIATLPSPSEIKHRQCKVDGRLVVVEDGQWVWYDTGDSVASSPAGSTE